MRALCASIAVSIAVASAALAAASAADLPPPERDEDMPWIVRCVVESLQVDGLPVVQHGWCYWDTGQRMWIPLSRELARERVFGIRPIPE